MTESGKTIGGRIRTVRTKKGLTQVALAHAAGITASYLSRIETGKKSAGAEALTGIARALDENIEYFTSGRRRGPALPVRYAKNPKPLRLGDVVVDRVFLIVGNHKDPLDLSVRYQHKPVQIPQAIRPLYRSLAERAKQAALRGKYPYFNGPTARLLCVSQENTRQLSSGIERKGLVLELGPLSWEQFTVLNTFLDERLFPGTQEDTIRKRYARTELLYRNGPDVRWCQLANLFAVIMTPITSDGYGLVQRRSSTGVSVEGDRFISGVSENMHRYLDEAHPDNLAARLHTLASPAAAPVDSEYPPTGVPSPLLTAMRGVYEELSESMYLSLQHMPERFKFLDVIFSFDYFNPMLLGVIELPYTRAEVERHIQESPGNDHTELTEIHYLKLDPENARTAEFLSDKRRWSMAGLSALIAAIQYWRSHHR